VTAWRVVTWNVLGAADPDLDVIAARLRDRSPDVVALQEVRRSQAKALAKLLGWDYVWARKHYPYSPLIWWRAEGLAIVSPYELVSPEHVTLSVGEPIWTFRHRVMVAATVVRPLGSRLRVYDLHLANHHADHRIDQARRAAAFILKDRPDDVPAVVCGDFNAELRTDLEIAREFHIVGVHDIGGVSTNPSQAPHQRLDAVFAPDDATVHEVGTPEGGEEWLLLSDHLPVLAVIELPD
jgi:endonuclease/exonuclease/phosphatase family metal-dependent hydrolase